MQVGRLSMAVGVTRLAGGGRRTRVAGIALLALLSTLIVAVGSTTSPVGASTVAMVTVAGTGVEGYNGDSIQALSAQLARPRKLTLDGSGNLYIVESFRIRKVDGSGVITTVAGTGEGGFNGDGIAATSAQINQAEDVTFDNSGNLLITENIGSRVRKVDVVTGLISTVAGTGIRSFSGDGGPATLARIRQPRATAVDAAGNLYIADTNNHRIRKVDVGTGFISTIAGNGCCGFEGDGGPASSARFQTPSDIIVDSSGNLLIADEGNARVRKIDTSGNIDTIAGNGGTGFSGDGAAATAAEISAPTGLSLDSAGNLFLADIGNHRIRRVDASANIDTVAGGGSPADGLGDALPPTQGALDSPLGTVVSPAGVVYISDTGHHRVRVVREVDDLLGVSVTDSPDPVFAGEPLTYNIAVANNIGSTTATGVTLVDPLPEGVSFDSATPSQGSCGAASDTVTCDLGSLAVGESATVAIVVIPGGLVTGTLTNTATVAANEADNFDPNDSATAQTEVVTPDLLSLTMTGGPDPVDVGNPITYDLTVTNNHPSQTATFVTIRNQLPSGASLDSASSSQGTCGSADANGLVTCSLGTLAIGTGATATIVATPTLGGPTTNNAVVVSSPVDLVPENNSASAQTQVNALDSIALSMSHTMINMEAVVGKPFSYVIDLVNFSADPATGIQLTDTLPPNTVVNRTGTSQGVCNFGADAVFCDLGTLDSGATAKVAVTLTPSEPGMITNTATVVINEFDQTPFNNTATLDTFVIDDPSALFVVAGHPNGFTGDGNDATATQFERAGNLAVDATGNIYVAGDNGSGRLLRIDPSGVVTTFAGTGTPGFSGDGGPATSAQIRSTAVAVDGSGNVYISEEQNHRIRKVDTSGIITTYAGTGIPGFSGDGGPATAADLNSNAGITTDLAGNVYVVDRGNRRVRKVDASGIITTIAGDGTTNFADNVPATTTGLSGALDVAVGPAGDVFITTEVNHFRIRKVDPAGIITTVAGSGAPFGCNPAIHDGQPATSVPLRGPSGLEVDAVGNVYFGNLLCGSSGSVHRVDTTGKFTTLIPRFENEASPFGLALSPGGATLYIGQPDALRQVLGFKVGDLLELKKEAVSVAVGAATWEMTVTNRGLVGATGITLTDTLPPGVVFQSATPTQGTCARSGSTVTCPLGALAPGGVAKVTLRAAPAAGQVGQTMTNTATVTQNEPDPAPANNTATTQTFVSGKGCGQVIKKNTTLTADIGPCDRDGVIIGKNGITLNLNGHRIFGTPGPGPEGSTVGVRLPNRANVTVKGPGTVSDFDAGVFVNGGRKNILTRMTVRDNIGIPDTFLTDFGDGILLFNSPLNEISNNNVIHNGPYDGIGVFGAGSNGNVIRNNISRDNIGDGGPNGQGIIVNAFIETFDGALIENNVIRNNTVRRNDSAGISNVNTRGSQVLDNVVENNGFRSTSRFGNGIGITLGPGAGDNHTNALVKGNQVHGNAHYGILITRPDFASENFFSRGNSIIDNNAADNAVEDSPFFDYVDLFDRDPDCLSNIWSGNVWGSGGFSPECTTTGGSGPIIAAAQAEAQADQAAASAAAADAPEAPPRRRPR